YYVTTFGHNADITRVVVLFVGFGFVGTVLSAGIGLALRKRIERAGEKIDAEIHKVAAAGESGTDLIEAVKSSEAAKGRKQLAEQRAQRYEVGQSEVREQAEVEIMEFLAQPTPRAHG